MDARAFIRTNHQKDTIKVRWRRSHSTGHSEVLGSLLMIDRGDKSGLVHFDAFDNFQDAKAIPPATITPELKTAVRRLDEREEFEPFIQFILSDSNETPHGPAEIADILTHKLTTPLTSHAYSSRSDFCVHATREKLSRAVALVDILPKGEF